MFLRLFSGVEFGEAFRRFRGFARLLQLPFSSPAAVVPMPLERALEVLLAATPRKGKCTDAAVVRAVVDCIEERENSLMTAFEVHSEHSTVAPRKDLRAIIERLRAPSPLFIGINVQGQDELLLRVVLEALEEGDSQTMLPLEDCREFVEGAHGGRLADST